MKQHTLRRADKSREMDFAVVPAEQEEHGAAKPRRAGQHRSGCTGTSDSKDGISASGGTHEHGTFSICLRSFHSLSSLSLKEIQVMELLQHSCLL